MSVPTVAVSIAAAMFVGSALPGATVQLQLTGFDIVTGSGGALVAPEPLNVTLAADGTAVVQLFPNVLGTRGTQYKVTVLDQYHVVQFSGLATIPNSACNLHDQINAAAPAAVPVYPGLIPLPGQVLVGNAGGTAYAPVTVKGGASLAADGTLTVLDPGQHAQASKATPVDADEVPLADSAAAFAPKKLTWASVKATLKSYFDTLYLATIAPLVIASANIIEQRNGANEQTFRLYGNYVDPANYLRLKFGWSGNCQIGTEGAGTGVSGTDLSFTLNGSPRILLAVAGPIYFYGPQNFGTDNIYDIGTPSANRPRIAYFGTSVVTPTVQTADAIVSALPAAAAGNRGQRRHVTDSTVAASGNFGATVAGGGANVVPVFSTGTAWIIA